MILKANIDNLEFRKILQKEEKCYQDTDKATLSQSLPGKQRKISEAFRSMEEFKSGETAENKVNQKYFNSKKLLIYQKYVFL